MVKRVSAGPIRAISPWKAFLLAGTVFGLLFLFVTPPFQAPDEPNHFFRAWQISEGIIIAQRTAQGIGGAVPAGLIETVLSFDDLPFHRFRKQGIENTLKTLSVRLDDERRVFVDFPNAALYSPVPYLPQASGIALARVFGLSPLFLMYAGRLANLAAWLVLVSCAVTMMPIRRWMLVLVALTPMTLFLSASLSADSLTIALTLFLTALIMREALQPVAKIGNSSIALIFFISILLSLCKQVYFFFSLLALMIPARKFGGVRRYGTFLLFLAVLSLTAPLLWSVLVEDLYRGVFEVYGSLLPGVSPQAQLRFIFSNPLSYLRVLFMTFAQGGPSLAGQLIGHLGWIEVPLPVWLNAGYGLLLFFVAIAGGDEKGMLSLKQKSVIIAVTCATVVAVCTILYMTLSPVGAATVAGLQGRYFTPLAPLVLLLFHIRNVPMILEKPVAKAFVILGVVFALASSVVILARAFYA